MFDIDKTLSNDSPAITEIEAVESVYSGIERSKVDKFLVNPFTGTSSTKELDYLKSYLGSFIKIRLKTETDKGTSYTTIPVINFDRVNKYIFIIRPGGTGIRNVELDAPGLPLFLENVSIVKKNLSFEEIQRMDLIKKFSKN